MTVATRALRADLLYGRLLASAAQGPAGPRRARIRLADGRLEPLPLDRWLAPADEVDQAILADVAAPVLDLGCGPGRHLAALRALGKRGLGVDLSPVAVRSPAVAARDAINGSLWADVPGAGRGGRSCCWTATSASAAKPVALLRRAGELLDAGRRDRRRDRSAGGADAADADPDRGAGPGLGVVPLGARRASTARPTVAERAGFAVTATRESAAARS